MRVVKYILFVQLEKISLNSNKSIFNFGSDAIHAKQSIHTHVYILCLQLELYTLYIIFYDSLY